jgi:serine phosphatase RsbU (regulator of sigma subunit)
MEYARYTDGCFQLNPDEPLFLYSDGVKESCNLQGELFSEAQLAQTIRECCSHDPREMCLNALEQVRIHQGEAQQADDITIPGFRLNDSGTN